MADTQGGSTSLVRDYRKGNWTVSETMILIEAKKMDDERRMKRSTGNESSEGIRINKPAELRWKWVEDYCWRKGCLRSQNQCNDKWDNLMRDYKKVRDYERKLDHDNNQQLSYWKIEKTERKEKNLPTNMLPQIYEALVDVVEKKVMIPSGVSTPTTSVVAYNVVETSAVANTSTTSSIQHQYQHHHHQQQGSLIMGSQALLISSSMPSPITALPLPPSPTPIHQLPPILPYSHPPILPTMCDSSDSDTSEHSDSPAKRRRKSRESQEQQGTTTSSPRNINTTSAFISSPSPSNVNDVASAISKSSSIIAEALLAREEREDTRHRDLLRLHQRRLEIEESKAEVNRQGINGLVDAINNLANSIHALASDKHQSSSSKPS